MTTKEHLLLSIKKHQPEFTRLDIRDTGLYGANLQNEQSGWLEILNAVLYIQIKMYL